jgi:hypothetical protein
LRDDVVPEAQARWYPLAPERRRDARPRSHAVSEGLHDAAFLERYCHGADRFIAYVLGRTTAS